MSCTFLQGHADTLQEYTNFYGKKNNLKHKRVECRPDKQTQPVQIKTKQTKQVSFDHANISPSALSCLNMFSSMWICVKAYLQ